MDKQHSYRQAAITRLFTNGIGVQGKEFDRLLKEYNSFKMPLGTRHKLIADDMDPEFLEFVKNKISLG